MKETRIVNRGWLWLIGEPAPTRQDEKLFVAPVSQGQGKERIHGHASMHTSLVISSIHASLPLAVTGCARSWTVVEHFTKMSSF